MVREILEILFNFIKSRMFIAFFILFLMFGILLFRVFNLQIVNSNNYVNKYTQKTERTRYNNSARGNIYDADGKLLAYNISVYSVVIEDTLDSSSKKSEQMNGIIHTTIGLIEKHGDSIDKDFPIEYVDDDFIWSTSISNNTKLRFLKDIYGTETLDTEDEKLSESTAEEAFEFLVKKYKVDLKEYSRDEACKIIIVRNNLSLNAYQKYLSTTIATDVSDETVAAIYESSDVISGVTISNDTKRVYNYSTYFAHIIGYTGKISDEQLGSLNSQLSKEQQQYVLNDIAGKTGIESSMELELSGNKGYEKVVVDNTGKVISVIEDKPSEAGNDIYLTIKSDLQIGIYNLIEENLASILIDKIVNRSLSAKDAEDWLIPIKDVYFQIINNNIIDIEKLNQDGSSENEKKIYNTMVSKKETVIANIKSELYNSKASGLASLGVEYNEYYTYIFNMLSDSSYGINIIPKSKIDTEDDIYKSWMRDEISLREILLYAIDSNWVDTSLLDVDSSYIDRETIYTSLVEFIEKYLNEKKAFNKLVYKYLIENGQILGSQICCLLYDQEVLKYDAETYTKLSSGRLSSFDFMIGKIRTLEVTPAMLALEPCSATVTVVEPGTNNVLAMVSYPSYDNNNFSGSIDYGTWTALSEDLSSPLFDRATKMRTAPGSTFKPLSAITGLETGMISPSDHITCKGIFETITPSPKCWIYPRAHGSIPVTKAIEVSCNCFFYEVGYRLATSGGSYNDKTGLSYLEKYGEMAGLTEKTGVEIEEYSPLFSNSSTVTSAIGQGSHSFTSVQLARYVNTLASDGTNYEFTLIKSIVDLDGSSKALEEKSSKAMEVSDSTIDIVQNGMYQASGTYSALKKLGYHVAAKTGTAQESANSPDHALMIGYAPYENPEISFSIMIQNGYNSSYAVNLSADILKYYFGETTLDQILKGTADGPAAIE